MRRVLVMLGVVLVLAGCDGPNRADLAARMRIDLQQAISTSVLPGLAVTQSEFQEHQGSHIYVVQYGDPLLGSTPPAPAEQALFDVPLGALRDALARNPGVIDQADTVIVSFQDSCQSVYELSVSAARELAQGAATIATTTQRMSITSLCG